jgi:hypothetical protein
MATIKSIWYGCLCSSLLIAIWSCKKDKESDPLLTKVDLEKGKAVLVLNEGNFTRGNADITLWQNNTATPNIYKLSTGRALGDVLQSLYIKGDTGYFVVNNSGKIEVMHLPDFKQIHTITGMQSPRYIIPLGDGNALITEYYSKKIHTLNPATFQITQSNAMPGWVNKAVVHNGRLIFPLADRPLLYVYDLNTFIPLDSILIPNITGEIVMDKLGRVWTAASYRQGSFTFVEMSIYSFDTNGRIFLGKSVSQSGGSLFTSMSINNTADTIYLLSRDFYKIPIDKDFTHTAPHIVSSANSNYYGFGVHPDGRIFLSNARDFVSKGEVDVFSATGQKITTFPAGIIPQSVYFY